MNSQVRHFFISINIAIAITLLLACFFTIRSCSNATSIEKTCNTNKKVDSSNFITLPESNIFAAAKDVMIEQPIRTSNGELSKRFRLAGIIFGTQNYGAINPQAIIDDKQLVKQSVVMRGDEIISGITVVEVKRSSVVLRDKTGEQEIFLERDGREASFTTNKKEKPTPLTQEAAAKRFGGVEVFPNRWEFDRGAVINYYDELMNHGDRMLSVFDSMDPMYERGENGKRKITGYVVGVEGEEDFFIAAGLENGDIVRAVNSVPMSNRRLAENFIKEFVNGQTEMFVLEVERKGKIEKKVYTIK